MDGKKAVHALLAEHGVRVRHNKHEMWQVNGVNVVITGTKTDNRGWLNKLSEIRRALKVKAA